MASHVIRGLIITYTILGVRFFGGSVLSEFLDGRNPILIIKAPVLNP